MAAAWHASCQAVSIWSVSSGATVEATVELVCQGALGREWTCRGPLSDVVLPGKEAAADLPTKSYGTLGS